jgi:hypothetical protein
MSASEAFLKLPDHAELAPNPEIFWRRLDKSTVTSADCAVPPPHPPPIALLLDVALAVLLVDADAELEAVVLAELEAVLFVELDVAPVLEAMGPVELRLDDPWVLEVSPLELVAPRELVVDDAELKVAWDELVEPVPVPPVDDPHATAETTKRGKPAVDRKRIAGTPWRLPARLPPWRAVVTMAQAPSGRC